MERKMQEVLGRQSLDESIKDFGANSPDTKLKLDLSGRDPDQGVGDIAYEKGYFFLRTIEETVGRQKFDSFLKKWFDTNAFHSRFTEDFINYMHQTLGNDIPSFDEKVKVNDWVYKPGIPVNIPAVGSKDFTVIDSLLKKWDGDKNTDVLPAAIKSTNQTLYFLSHLPDSLPVKKMEDLDKAFHFTQSHNAEVQCAWYTKAIHNNYTVANNYIETFLTEVGRRKFLVPLYKEMIKTNAGKQWAKKIYVKARPNYHPIIYNASKSSVDKKRVNKMFSKE